ncbi:MAG: hypothetical protein R3C14_04895 [Caldilineaceae bacterium]
MANAFASPEECRPLYERMAQLKELAPWEWMMETDIFGVQGVGAPEPDYVSVMGMRGEHFAISLYLGNQALLQFWHFEENQEKMQAEDLLLIPQLQASFEDRNQLTQQDRDQLKALGLKYRGRHAWPMIRSFRPGFLPWYVESAEVVRLTQAVEQLLDVAPALRPIATSSMALATSASLCAWQKSRSSRCAGRIRHRRLRNRRPPRCNWRWICKY